MPEEITVVSSGSRRAEDIALDLMKFIAITAGYGKSAAVAAGFQPKPEKKEDAAESLLELYHRCRTAVEQPTTKRPAD